MTDFDEQMAGFTSDRHLRKETSRPEDLVLNSFEQFGRLRGFRLSIVKEAVVLARKQARIWILSRRIPYSRRGICLGLPRPVPRLQRLEATL